ncbi:MAG TPA: lytic transglycosylase domain-containing protein [Chitinophagaceae bacterium]|nr:lytic transglycosylase domain-containing protein [Chitinophagaceae bacterium]
MKKKLPLLFVSFFHLAVLNTEAQSVKDSLLTANDRLAKYGVASLFKRDGFDQAVDYQSQLHPLAWNFVQDYIRLHSKSLQKMKDWGLPYFVMIDNILSQYHLPKELKYLAVIESNLKNYAISWVGARGPWQFMPYTAREYGLNVNRWTDERVDYYKSTHAAAKYLNSLYNELNDWLLVIAAYNSGPANIYAAIKKSGSRDFWKLQYYLPEESRNHVKKFIATHYIMEGKSGITTIVNKATGDTLANAAIPEDGNTDKLHITGKFNSVVIAKNLSMDINEFNRLNPGFDAAIASSGNSYELRLPKQKMKVFISNKNTILNESVQLLLNFYGEDGIKTVYPKLEKLPEVKKYSSKNY